MHGLKKERPRKKGIILLVILMFAIIVACILLLNKKTESFVVDTNLCARVAISGNNEIVVTGADAFGISDDPGYLIEKPIHIKISEEIEDIAVSDSGIIVLSKKGNVYQLGRIHCDGKWLDIKEPTLITELHDVVEIDAGHSHYLALTNIGEVFAWGDNKYGESDPANKNDYLENPSHIEIPEKVDSIIADYWHSGVICNGRVYVWGDDGTDAFPTDPGMIKKLSVGNVSKVSFGKNHMIVMNSEGLWGWGSSEAYQLGIKTSYMDSEKIADSKVCDFECKGNYTVLKYEDTTLAFGLGFDGTTECRQEYVIANDDNCTNYPNMILCEYSIECTTNGMMYSKVVSSENEESKLCVIIDNGVLKAGNYSGYNIIDGSDCIQAYSYDNLHGDIVYNVIRQYSGMDEKNIFIIKAYSGDTGNAYDVIEGIFLAGEMKADIVNCSLSITDEEYKYLLSCSMCNSSEYHLAISNNQDSDAVYVNNSNALYCYDKDKTDVRWLEDMRCNTIGIELPEAYVESKAYSVYLEGNSLATAMATAQAIKSNIN